MREKTEARIKYRDRSADIPVRSTPQPATTGGTAITPGAGKNARTPEQGGPRRSADIPVRSTPTPVIAKRRVNHHIYQLVRDKREWEGPTEPALAAIETAIGSKGWTTRGRLPHYDKPGIIQMVTFRLADSMPAALRHEWEFLLNLENERERQTKLEAYLDAGHGSCWLRNAPVAEVVEGVFLRFDGVHYRMIAWVVMPNHVHLLFELGDIPLSKLLKAWKGTSANAANRLLGRTGTFWQEEYWDRFVRDESHFRKAKHYIEWNPVKAGMVQLPEHWPHGSANPKWQWSVAERYWRGHLTNRPTVQDWRKK